MILPFRARAGTAAGRTTSVPEGRRVYAIGDIHGRADLLGRMAALIEDELRSISAQEVLTVCLGDYIDRGPGSAKVIERLAHADFPTALVTLMGNHEDLFLKFLRGSLSLEAFFDNGGDATLQSYGLAPDAVASMNDRNLREALRAAIPLHHRAFLAALPTSWSVGDYFFCHAGARPGVSLDQQSAQDLMWIREDFLRSTFDFGKLVVHGHTPVKTPLIRANGIGIDTKAFASGVLTAIVLEGAERRFIEARL